MRLNNLNIRILEPGVVCNVNIVREEGVRQINHVQSQSDFARQERGNLGATTGSFTTIEWTREERGDGLLEHIIMSELCLGLDLVTNFVRRRPTAEEIRQRKSARGPHERN